MTPQIAIEILKRYKNHWFGDMLHDNGFVTVQQIIDMLTAQPDLDAIWENLSKVYNMPDVPDEALSIIGDVMLVLDGSKNA